MLNGIKEELMRGNVAKVEGLVREALESKVLPAEILNDALIAGMDIIGRDFKANKIYIPEVLIAASAMHAGLDILAPLLAAAGVEPTGKVAIGTVKGDLHDIGKNIVAMMFKGAGFKVEDLGIDVPPERFLEAAIKGDCQIIAMSSLLTTSMSAMKNTIELLGKNGLKGKIKTMVGGAPVTKSFADGIGADGYGDDAASAVDIARSMIGVKGA